MRLTQKKNQYAIRAIFELAKHMGEGPVKISAIAKAQSIPPRFLEVILSQMKGSGIVASKRGFYGGYSLIRRPDQIAVSDVINHLEGKAAAAKCMACEANSSCPFPNRCAFSPMWNQVRDAVFDIFDRTTIQDLINNEKR